MIFSVTVDAGQDAIDDYPCGPQIDDGPQIIDQGEFAARLRVLAIAVRQPRSIARVI